MFNLFDFNSTDEFKNIGAINYNIAQSNHNNITDNNYMLIENISQPNSAVILNNTLTYIWFTILILLFLYNIILYLKMKSNVKYATIVIDNIYETDRIKTPFIMGFIKPKIYIPAELAINNADYIIKHEQIHIKRFDYLIKLIAFSALVIHWFNPVIWLSYYYMTKDMEMSCDEAVLKSYGNDIRKGYSNCLVSFSEKQSDLFCTLSFCENNIKTRIKNIMNYKMYNPGVIITILIILSVLAFFLMTNPVDQFQDKAEKYLNYLPPNSGTNPDFRNIVALLDFPKDMKYNEIKMTQVGLVINIKANTKKAFYTYLQEQDTLPFQKNAVILLALIKNNQYYIIYEISCDGIEYIYQHSYSREQLNILTKLELREFSRDVKSLANFLNIAEKCKDFSKLNEYFPEFK